MLLVCGYGNIGVAVLMCAAVAALLCATQDGAREPLLHVDTARTPEFTRGEEPTLSP